jgi:predicted phage-related endonuclease
VIEPAKKFWSDLRQNLPPALDDSKATREYLNLKYPAKEEDVEIAIVEPEIIAIGVDHCTAKNILDDTKKNRETWGNQIIDYMGKHGANVATCDEWKATYRADKNKNRTLRVTARGELRSVGKVSAKGGEDDGEFF